MLGGISQQSFGSLIGASRDVVASWERCRAPIPWHFAEAISAATGVLPESIINGDGRLLTWQGEPYSFAFYKRFKNDLGLQDLHEVTHSCQQSIAFLFEAAAADPKVGRCVWPGLLSSYANWFKTAARDFGIESKLKFKWKKIRPEFSLSLTRREWRQAKSLSKSFPFNFHDDRTRPDDEQVQLEFSEEGCWILPKVPKGGKSDLLPKLMTQNSIYFRSAFEREVPAPRHPMGAVMAASQTKPLPGPASQPDNNAA
jgi:hypothetical protein